MFAPPPAEHVAESWRQWHARAREAASEAASPAPATAATAPDTAQQAGRLSHLTPKQHGTDCALASFFRAHSDSELSTLSDLSRADSPYQRKQKLAQGGQDAEKLRVKKRKAQMRLASLRNGHVKAKSGEPRCLEMFVADLGEVLRQPRGPRGRFASTRADGAPESI